MEVVHTKKSLKHFLDGALLQLLTVKSHKIFKAPGFTTCGASALFCTSQHNTSGEN